MADAPGAVTRHLGIISLVDPLTSGPAGKGYIAQTVATPARPYPSPENNYMAAASYPVSGFPLSSYRGRVGTACRPSDAFVDPETARSARSADPTHDRWWWKRLATHQRPGGSEAQLTRDETAQRETGNRIIGWGGHQGRADRPGQPRLSEGAQPYPRQLGQHAVLTLPMTGGSDWK
jgi:hypothetical protein